MKISNCCQDYFKTVFSALTCKETNHNCLLVGLAVFSFFCGIPSLLLGVFWAASNLYGRICPSFQSSITDKIKILAAQKFQIESETAKKLTENFNNEQRKYLKDLLTAFPVIPQEILDTKDSAQKCSFREELFKALKTLCINGVKKEKEEIFSLIKICNQEKNKNIEKQLIGFTCSWLIIAKVYIEMSHFSPEVKQSIRTYPETLAALQKSRDTLRNTILEKHIKAPIQEPCKD